jgi:hypothetical protein
VSFGPSGQLLGLPGATERAREILGIQIAGFILGGTLSPLEVAWILVAFEAFGAQWVALTTDERRAPARLRPTSSAARGLR